MRLVRLTPRFLAERTALGLSRPSPARDALGRTLATLGAAGTLPEPGDATTLLDLDERGVSTMVHVRRVASQNLWVWYLASDSDVVLVKLTRSPPSSMP